MDNEQLAARIQAGEDTAENMLQLWKQNKGFIFQMAMRYSGRAELEDLTQEGYIALCEAVRHYDPGQGVPFITYAAFWIKQGMRRYIENCGSCVRIPSHAQAWAYKYKRMTSEYRKYYGKEPSDEDLQALLHVSRKKLQDIKESARMGQIRSLSEPTTDEGEELTLESMVASEEDIEEDCIQRLDYQHMERMLWEAVDSLPGRQPAVIRCRFLDNKTMKEIGQKYGVSGEAIRHQQDKAMRELRKPSRSQKFKGYYEEYIQAAGSRHAGVQSFQRTWTSEVEREAIKDIEGLDRLFGRG
ncbi:sigma-70 family RNA polymerase sigma factor [Muricomes intestini]|uniref:sigma-70 family RNA polymerase sigma factor n=1 Tax=Muricomes intestini TaxID=1796634 RepID=UPI002FDD27C3